MIAKMTDVHKTPHVGPPILQSAQCILVSMLRFIREEGKVGGAASLAHHVVPQLQKFRPGEQLAKFRPGEPNATAEITAPVPRRVWEACHPDNICNGEMGARRSRSASRANMANILTASGVMAQHHAVIVTNLVSLQTATSTPMMMTMARNSGVRLARANSHAWSQTRPICTHAPCPAPCCNINKPGFFANGNNNADDDDYGAQLGREVGASQLTAWSQTRPIRTQLTRRHAGL